MITMAPTFSTPEALIQGLHERSEKARDQFQDWLREPIRRLMSELRARYGLDLNLDRLTEHALHSAETYLRARPIESFAKVSMRALRATLLLHVARQVHQPFGGDLGNGQSPAPLPGNDDYDFQTLFLPYEKVGSFWYGGDWYGGVQTQDGSLWVIVADVTGHGYYAYLLASTLPAIWDRCWELNPTPDDPQEVLTQMHELLASCLPEGIFVECTLLRLEPTGKVTIAPAGATRLLMRQRGESTFDEVKLRGLWLGFDPPCREDQHVMTLDEDDELVIGSDGVFDQLGTGEALSAHLAESVREGSLFDGLQFVLERNLENEPQKDDITLVRIRRRARLVSGSE